MLLNIYVDDDTLVRLEKIAREKQRTMQDLAECALSESCLDYFRHRKDDPARSQTHGNTGKQT